MSEIKVIKGDITKFHVDAIVNAANNELKGGGGVDGAIHRAGGPSIMEECRKIGFCETGEAVITYAGNLPAKFVIHTVGPIWNGGKNNEEQLLKNAYSSSLRLAAIHKLNTLAFPNISTGVYGFPKDLAAQIAVDTVQKFLFNNQMIMKVLFVCYDDENYGLYSKLLK